MAGANARLLVEVAASLGTFREDMGRAAAVAESNAKRIEGAFHKASDRLIDFGKDIARATVGAFGLTLGAEGIVRAFESMTTAAIEEEHALQQLGQTLAATGFAAGKTGDDLLRLAERLQGKTIFDDDDIRKAQIALLRFHDIQGATFDEALKQAADLATALGVKLPEAATLLGKALLDERGLRALKEVGVSLSEQSIDLVRSMREAGDAAGANQVIFDELSRHIGGLAENDNTGTYGSVRRLDRAWNDLKKTMGGQLLLPGQADRLTEFIERFNRVVKQTDQNRGLWQNFLDDVRRIGEILGVAHESFAFPETGGVDEAVKRAEERKALVGKLVQDGERAREKQYTDEKEQTKRLADLAVNSNALRLTLSKSALDLEQDALSFAYSRGEISTQDYYASLDKISRAGLETIQRDIEQSIKRQQDILDFRARDSSGNLTDKPGFSKQEREAAEQRQIALANQLEAVNAAFFKTDQQRKQQQILAGERLADVYGELAEKIALAEGDTAKAAAIATERANRLVKTQLETIRDTGSQAESAAARNALEQQKRLADRDQAIATLADTTRNYQNVVEALGIAQARVDLEAQTGQVSEIDLLNKKADVARQFIPLLTAQYEAQKKIVEADIDSGKLFGTAAEEALLKLQQEKLAIDQLSIAADGLKNKFDGIFTDNLTTLFDDLVGHTKSVSQAFKDMGRSIATTITHLVNEQIAKQLYKALFGSDTPGSFLSSLFGGGNGAGLASLFSGSSGAGASSYTFDAAAFVGANGFASGTSYAPGGWAWVGERGPELQRLPAGTQVMSYDQSVRYAASHGGPTIVQNINVLPGATRQTAAQAANEARRAFVSASRNA